MALVDGITLVSATAAFVVFIGGHASIFRRFGTSDVFRSLKIPLIRSAVIPSLLVWILSCGFSLKMPWPAFVCLALTASFVYGLLGFVYATSIFGAVAASVRMRVLHEIGLAGREGVSREELLLRYNSELIARARLQRLASAGYVVEQEGVYRKAVFAGKEFRLLQGVARVLKRIVSYSNVERVCRTRGLERDGVKHGR